MNSILDFKTLYPQLEEKHRIIFDELVGIFTDFKKLGYFLSLLEKEVNEVMTSGFKIETAHFDEFGNTVPDDELEFVLRKHELQFGFSSEIAYAPAGNEGVGEGGIKLPMETFRKIISSHQVFYDYGASRIHGEITHRIQLYILLNHISNNFTIEPQKLPTAATELYELTINEKNTRIYKRDAKSDPYTKYLWNDVFDYGPKKMHDARSPLWLNIELIKGQYRELCPAISQSLTKRYVARHGYV